jgi:hypothetical protein
VVAVLEEAMKIIPITRERLDRAKRDYPELASVLETLATVNPTKIEQLVGIDLQLIAVTEPPAPTPTPGPVSPIVYPITRPSEFLSYGLDNMWMEQSLSVTLQMAAALRTAGLTATTIEYYGRADRGRYGHGEIPRGPFREFHRAMISQTTSVFVSIANDNKGLNKPGNSPGELINYMPDLKETVDWFAEMRFPGVIIQPVAETRTVGGRELESYAVAKLKGIYPLVYNGGSRPTSAHVGYDWFAYHPLSLDDAGPRNAFVITDTTPAINACKDVARLEAYARKVLSDPTRGVGCYDYDELVPRYDAISALGRAKRSSPNIPQPPDASTEPGADSTSLDEIDYSALAWCYGRPNGEKAMLDERVRIANLRVGSGGFRIDWVGGLDAWGLSHTDAGALACAFYRAGDGRMQGGKIDWISTSRSTRSWENIDDHYNGWQCSNKKTEWAFVVLSRDGKRRSNVIRAEYR